MHRRVLLVCLALCMGLIAACGPEPTAAVPPGEQTRPVTLEAETQLLFADGCSVKDLADWLENTQFLAEEFVATFNRAAVLPPTEQDSTLSRLHELRGGLSDIVAPNECAGELHRLVAGMMDDALTALQAYATEGDIDLVPVVEQVNSTLADLQTQQQALLARLDSEFQATQAALEN